MNRQATDEHVAKLHKRAQKALADNLAPSEEVRVVIRGTSTQAIVGTDTRAFVLKVGWLAGATLGATVTTFDYRNISGVQAHKKLMSGAVVIETPGLPGTRASYWGTGNQDASKAPNAIPVPGDWKTVQARVATLRQLIADAQQHGNGAAPAPSVADELRKLAELRDTGILSAAEFESQKARLLS